MVSQSADTSCDSSLSNVLNSGVFGAFLSRLDGPNFQQQI